MAFKDIPIGIIEIIVEHIDEMKKIQRESGSKDEYGRGLYNGMEVIRANISGENTKFVNKDFTIEGDE